MAKKLVAVVKPAKPVSAMSEQERHELAVYTVAQVNAERAQAKAEVPAPEPEPS